MKYDSPCQTRSYYIRAEIKTKIWYLIQDPYIKTGMSASFTKYFGVNNGLKLSLACTEEMQYRYNHCNHSTSYLPINKPESDRTKRDVCVCVYEHVAKLVTLCRAKRIIWSAIFQNITPLILMFPVANLIKNIQIYYGIYFLPHGRYRDVQIRVFRQAFRSD
jgi:hypothetical protein